MTKDKIATPYEDLLADVLDNGVFKEDRTQTGTYSKFGAQLRYDLTKSFPLITTKKVNFHSVVGELLWFLRGETNNQWLKDNNIKIWNEWADDYGQLGSIYGSQWRHWYKLSDDLVSVPIVDNKKDAGTKGVVRQEFLEDTRLHFFTLEKKYPNINPSILKLWVQYTRKYKLSHEWYDVRKFAHELSCAPGFSQWYAYNSEYQLFPQYYGTDILSFDSAIFLPTEYASKLNDDREYSTKEFSFDNTEHVDANGNKALLRKRVYRDQIADIVELIKENPDSRRIILNAWNVGDLDNMALPPCHVMFQFYVSDGKLSGMLTQRSADLFLGVPFNIASYSLLIHMVARLTGLGVGEFIWNGGDCHIYANHVEQVKEQLSREPREYPQIEFVNDADTALELYQFEDIVLHHYDPHPFIKGAVAV